MSDPSRPSPLHPVFRVLWWTLHLGGIPAAELWHLWGWYAAAVAVLEAVALVSGRRGTWSEQVWDLMYDGYGQIIGWRLVVPVAWSLWFAIRFMQHGWTGTDLDVLMAFAFLVWIWAHFLTDHYHSRLRPHG